MLEDYVGMTAEQRVPDDHPLMIAWRAYQATDEAKNSERWATHFVITKSNAETITVAHPHTTGSLWAAFVAGWEAANAAR